MIDLTGRRVVVTGGSRGIGAACCRLFARAGASVFIQYMASGQKGGRGAAGAAPDLGRPALGGPLRRHRAGVRSSKLFDAIEARWGGLDCLINNAGVWVHDPLPQLQPERLQATFSVNIVGPFLCARSAIPLLAGSEDGSIINISSTAGQRGEAFYSAYAASKGAMISATKSWSSELAAGIRVNAVAPGWVDTDMTAEASRASGARRSLASIPLRRIATPEDIAGLRSLPGLPPRPPHHGGDPQRQRRERPRWLACRPSGSRGAVVRRRSRPSSSAPGSSGLSTAYWLSRAGRHPLVLDADGVASHASGRNAGYLMTGTAEPYTWLVGAMGEAAAFRLWELSSENRELLRGELLDAGQVDCEFTPGRGVDRRPGGQPGQERGSPRELRAARGARLSIEWRRPPRCGGRAAAIASAAPSFCRAMGVSIPPTLPGDRAAGGRGRRGDPHRGARPPAGACGRAGPHRLRRRASPRPAGRPGAQRLRAGARAHLVGEIRPVRGQMFATAPGPRDLTRGLVRQRRLRVPAPASGRHPDPRRLPPGGPGDRGGLRGDPDRSRPGRLRGFPARSLPAFRGPSHPPPLGGHHGLHPRRPAADGEVPGIPGAIYAAGFNGHGMSLGFATGRYLARQVCGEDLPPLFS